MVTNTIYTVQLSIIKKIILVILSGAFTGGILALVFYLFDPTSWKMAPNENAFINIVIMMIFGMLFSNIYYRHQFRKYKQLSVEIDDSIKVLRNNEIIHDYPAASYKSVVIDHQFYFIYKLKRVTLRFTNPTSKKPDLVVLLLDKERISTLNERLSTLKNNSL
ncbi:hypothetical protein [Liberiplasma polymorphum]|uniref:hypothetical protein n=1 Tax=Liberiplasma polymorphum TaxID=3374570 RepID=UPI00377242F3